VAGTDQIATGSRLLAQLDTGVDSQTSMRGDRFGATVISPVLDDSGHYVIPPSTRIVGHVASVSAPGPHEHARITLVVDGMYVGTAWIPLRASILSVDTSKAGPHGKGISSRLVVALDGGVVPQWRANLANVSGQPEIVGAQFAHGNQASIPPGSQILLRLERPLSVAALRAPAARTAIGGGPWK
jgi:hypothetical protein